jgi:hypothetical protein
MQIQVIRPFFLAGDAKLIGDVLDVPEALAAELIHTRKALGVVLEPVEPTEKPRRARKDKD